MKTIFGEEIKVDDEIMYFYKSQGTDFICFGKVLQIRERPCKYRVGGVEEVLDVHKMGHIRYGRDLEKVDKKTFLTSPLVVKCNQLLTNPFNHEEKK